MVWAATTYTTTDGYWNNAIWSAGVPTIDSYAEVRHNVTTNGHVYFAGLYVDGGILTRPGTNIINVKDAAGTHAGGEHIRISDNAASGFNTTGTKAIPGLIRSNSTTPTYPVKMLIMNKANPDARTFGFDYCELRNFAPSLGNQTNYLFFNTGDVTNDGVLNTPSPIVRAQKIDDVYCEGRSYSRVYPEGGYAGVLELSGLVPWTGYSWQTLIAMRDARTRVSYIGQFCSMPKAIIESLRLGRRDGPYLPFTITLVEDR